MGADLAPDEPFGPYLVYERLGVGGMATVHRALERGIEGFERIVALKRLLPHLAEDASFIKSFVREAKLASLLNHVNIVQIFELGRVGTEYFISMEYIDGKDIRRILRHARKVTGPPPIHVTVGLMIQLCEALDYAHAKVDDHGHPLGLVHRDVSPSNLLVTQAGHLKVIDFGIAKAQSQQLRTQTGRVKGKLAYMAPEAVSGGRELDARSDLFAAGVILHELLTARPLFASKNEYQTLLKVQRGDIQKPSHYNKSCPPELDAICLQALERDPDERWASAADMRDALHALRRQFNLQTGHRDVSQWLTWAFSIEPPQTNFGAAGTGADHSTSFDSRHMRRTPAPRKEDEEAVEIAWGGGEAEGSAEPVVLDEVPDVSQRNDNSVAARLGAQAFAQDLEDDIPMSTPSHGPTSRVMQAMSDDLDSLNDIVPPKRRSTTSMPVAARPPTATAQNMFHTPIPERHSPAPLPPPPPVRARTTSPQMHVPRQTPVPARQTPPPTPPQRQTPPPLPSSSASGMPSAGPPSERSRRITDRGAGAVATARMQAIVEQPPSSGDDDFDTLKGDKKRSELRRGHPDTLDPDPDASAPRYKPPTNPGDLITARPSATSLADLEPKRVKRPSDVTIGQAMIQRQSGRKTWVILVGLGVAGAAATAITLVATQGKDEVKVASSNDKKPGAAPMTPERGVGTVKFSIEPADAEIKLVEESLDHAGSPWTTQLSAGNHQIQIQRDGYKAWLTTIELSANETQTLRVVLEPLSKEKPSEKMEATLILESTPLGLDAFLDDKPLGVTPIKAQIRPGHHTIEIRKDGYEAWKQELSAKASANYEFSPSMSEDKQRERAQRAANPVVSSRREREKEKDEPKPTSSPAPSPVASAPPSPPPSPSPSPVLATATTDKTVEKPPVVAPSPVPSPSTPPVTKPSPSPVASVAPSPSPSPSPTPVAVAVPKTSGTLVVPPTSVTRISGAPPTVGKTKRAEVPSSVAAKVCIDTSGTVTNVDMITKLERLTSQDLKLAIQTWKYAPYKQAGTAVPVCFVVSFRVQ